MAQEIFAVTPRSPAARAGLRPGDELLSIGGEPVIDFLDYEALTAERQLTLRVRRDGEVHKIRIRKG